MKSDGLLLVAYRPYVERRVYATVAGAQPGGFQRSDDDMRNIISGLVKLPTAANSALDAALERRKARITVARDRC